MQALKGYLEQLQAVAQQPHATGELSYHGALERLLRTLRPDLTLVHEPTRTVVGRPDFAILHQHAPVGYVEAEAYAADLDNLPPHAKAQTDAFRQHLENFLLTNFLEFRLYRAGQEVMRARLPQPPPHGKIALAQRDADECLALLQAFLGYAPAPVADAHTLAQQLAQRAQLLKATVEQSLDAQLKQPPAMPLELRNLYRALQHALLPDLQPADFADLYAQTLAYGLFAARCYAPNAARFTRHDAAHIIPDAIPFLKRLLGTLTTHTLEPELEWLLDDLASLLERAEMHAILQDFGKRAGREDPVVHFYEDFLAAYDPTLREVRGVYYTPEPVVQFIVRAVDSVLRRAFGMQGLMDARALVLDPACGTGSFLYEIVRQVHAQVCEQLGAGQWADYARQQLLPRLFGFELLMAPYTIAHLKLALELQHLGAPPAERLRIYLTNALEPAVKTSELLLGEFITREANEAAEVKREKPILVVLGNPPYSGHSANRSYVDRKRKQPTWIGELIEDYKQVDGQPLEEKNPKWLQDDYVKFIRFAEWRIEQTGRGVVAFITNHAYLDNPTFRGMRAHLLRTFQRLYIVNLHGNARRKERAPDGSPDENLFDIQQGVAILIAIRNPNNFADSDDSAPVCYCDVWGVREEKYDFLRTATLESIRWTPLTPRAPMYLFVPQDTALEAEYLRGWRIPDIFPVHSVGIATARDALTIHRTPDAVWQTVCELVALEPEVARNQFQLGERTARKRIQSLIDDLKSAGVPDESAKARIMRILYRPFDVRYTFYTGKPNGFHERPRPEVMHHLLAGENVALITLRQQSRDADWRNVGITNTLAESSVISNYTREIGYVFPLYRYPDTKGEQGALMPEAGRKENLSAAFLEALAGVLGQTPAPEAVLGYLYAVLHSPTYRARYAEFLKRDFPRVPLPPDKATFDALAQLGGALIDLHLLRDPALNTPSCKYPVGGDHRVERVEYDEKAQRVWINGAQYFEPVPPEMWAYRVGGYQVCHKWLDDRKGAVLSLDERLIYQKMITALERTLALQAQIDALACVAWGW
jgi:predicted helicase